MSPFKSKAQMRKFYSDQKLRKYADEFMQETRKPDRLPERKSKRVDKLARQLEKRIANAPKRSVR